MTTIDPQLKSPGSGPDGTAGRRATSPGTPPPSDAELIGRLRSGEGDVAGELFARHRSAAEAVARQFVRNSADADDLVSDAFSRVFNAIRNGLGPTENFRAYLYTAVRSSAYRRHADSRRFVASAPTENIVDIESAADPVTDTFDRSAAGRAYPSLPQRWQSVLWMVEVEQRPASEVALVLGITPNAVAALTYRAREGLRQAFLSAHAREPRRPECQVVRPMLSAFVRDNTSERDTRRVVEHLKRCDDCIGLVAELRDVNDTILHGIAALLLPVAGIAALRALPPLGVEPVGVLAGSNVASATGAGATAPASSGPIAKSATSLAKFAGRVFPPPFPAAVTIGTAAVASVTAAVLLISGVDNSTVEQTAPDEPVVLNARTSTTVEGVTASAEAGELVLTLPGLAGSTESADSDTAVEPVGPSASDAPAPANVPPAAPSTEVEPPPAPAGSPASVGPGTVRLTQLGSISAEGNAAVVVDAAPSPGFTGTARVSWTLPPGASLAAANSEQDSCTDDTCIVEGLEDGQHFSIQLDVRVGPASLRAGALSGASPDASVTATLDDPTGALEPSTASVQLNSSGGPFHTLFAGIGNYSLAATGNSVLTCDDVDPDCGAARNRIGERLANDYYPLVPLTGGTPGGTTRSSAMLDLPDGASIRHAELVWSGQMSERGNDHSSTRSVTLDAGSGPTQVTARWVRAGERSGYQATADVTGLLASAGAGPRRITVSDVAVDVVDKAWGGWALAVVVESPQTPRRAAVLVVGMEPGDTATELFGGRDGRIDEILAVHWEGDANLRGDALEIRGGGTDALLVGDAANPLDDLANSTVSIRGRRPDGVDPNTFGVDVDLIRVADTWRNRIEIGAAAGAQEVRYVGLLGATIELG